MAERRWAGAGARSHPSTSRTRRGRSATATATGVDLPGEATGRVPDRQWRREYWEANKDYYCNFDEQASRQTDRESAYLQRFYEEFCADGYQYAAR